MFNDELQGHINEAFEFDNDAAEPMPLTLNRTKNAIIDVYWFYDDGGLSMLIPYLLAQQQSYLQGASM